MKRDYYQADLISWFHHQHKRKKPKRGNPTVHRGSKLKCPPIDFSRIVPIISREVQVGEGVMDYVEILKHAIETKGDESWSNPLSTKTTT